MKYRIVTFGCQINKSDSEHIAANLENNGCKPASKENEADLIVVNMCSVRQPAVDRILGLAQKFARLKTINHKLQTILTGCILPQDKNKFAGYFDKIIKTSDLLENAQCYGTVRSTVYVPISNGCSNACTYCVVPFTRGPLTCRKPMEIINEIKNAIKKGAHDIWLLGQNVNNYMSEQKTKNKKQKINFAKLLKIVNDIPGDFQIRFMSPNPKDFSDELIDVMAKSKKVAKFLNLPVQSGDDEILRKMNRKYTASQYKKLVEKIRKKIPDINLSTDVIVGFPGETKKQFENTVKLFKKLKFNIAYISKYSRRFGTAAFRLKDDVPIKEKQRRWKILNSLLS